jgi:hypothetical protein
LLQIRDGGAEFRGHLVVGPVGVETSVIGEVGPPRIG